MSNPYHNATDKVSVLGPTLLFKGELSAEEDLMLRGRVEGAINHTASLRIGKEGSVKGDIRAKNITVEGRVEGDLRATESIIIKEGADVEGNAFAPAVSLIAGARFRGSIDMASSGQSRGTQTPDKKSSDAVVDDLSRDVAAAGR